MNLRLKIPPPVVTLLFAGAMGLASRLVGHAGFPGQGFVTAALFGLGLAVAASGVVAFGRARTTVSPTRPEGASQLVTGGVYRFTRNPMYLGMALVLAAWAVLLGSFLSFVFVPLFVLYLNRFQISPEEGVLLEKFGGTYRAYQKKVRRWL